MENIGIEPMTPALLDNVTMTLTPHLILDFLKKLLLVIFHFLEELFLKFFQLNIPLLEQDNIFYCKM